jgi:hypothetical protein
MQRSITRHLIVDEAVSSAGAASNSAQDCRRRVTQRRELGNYGFIKPPAAALIAASVRVAARNFIRALSM